MNSKSLNRFIVAQEGIYETALSELKAGRKSSHWIWFIFPQIKGLGRSETAQYYAIQSKQEAHDYLEYPVLAARLIECTKAVLAVKGRTISQIFSYPDDVKFHSSMSLFALLSESDSVFKEALDKFFDGEFDLKTEKHLSEI